MLSNVLQRTHVVLLNIILSHLQSFRATGVSSGLATTETLTPMTKGRLGVYYEGMDTLWFNFCLQYMDVVALRFKRHTLSAWSGD